MGWFGLMDLTMWIAISGTYLAVLQWLGAMVVRRVKCIGHHHRQTKPSFVVSNTPPGCVRSSRLRVATNVPQKTSKFEWQKLFTPI